MDLDGEAVGSNLFSDVLDQSVSLDQSLSLTLTYLAGINRGQPPIYVTLSKDGIQI